LNSTVRRFAPAGQCKMIARYAVGARNRQVQEALLRRAVKACYECAFPPASKSANSLIVNSIVAAATFSSKWETFEVPGIGSMMGLRCRVLNFPSVILPPDQRSAANPVRRIAL
jgi:hypothetical protein